MKQFYAVSLGLVSSIQRDYPVQNRLIESSDIADDAVLDLESAQVPENGYSVHSGSCIKLRDKYNIFDLKLLERRAGSSAYDLGSAVNCIPKDLVPDDLDQRENYHEDVCGDDDAASLLLYKICQPRFQFPHRLFSLDPEEDTLTRDQEQISAAFWGRLEASDNNRVYLKKTFSRATWDSTPNDAYDETDEQSKKYSGLFFHFAAENVTDDGEDCKVKGPNSVRFDVTCDAEASEEIIWTRSSDSSDCDIKYEASNSAGCYIDASSYFRWVNGFSAFIMIGVGVFLVFAGANFIKWVCGLVVFLIVQAFVFALSYSYDFVDPVTLFRSQEVSGRNGTIAILVLIISVMLGGLVAWYATQHVTKVFFVYLAFQNGCILGFMLLSLLPFHLAASIVLTVGGIIGVAVAYFSVKNLLLVKTWGTAAFGSFLLTKGVGSFVGGFPALFDNLQNGEIDDTELQKALEGNMCQWHIGYFAAMIVLTIAGALIQKKYTCVEQAMKESFEGEKQASGKLGELLDKQQNEGGGQDDLFVRLH